MARVKVEPMPTSPTPEDLTDFQRAVVAVVSHLQPGEVVTYREVAIEAGHPGASQAVANVLRQVDGLPWWRVVPSSGRLYRTHVAEQAPKLAAEGISVDAHRRIEVPEATGRRQGRRATR